MNQTLGQKLLRTKTASKHQDGGLARTMGVFPLTMIGVGATIGTGIFFTMVEAVPMAGPAVILSFLLAALTAGLTALCYAELSFRIPASGSSYSFAYATLGEFAAFIVAACLLLEYGLAASATAIGWSEYLNNFLQMAFQVQIPESLRSPMFVPDQKGDVSVKLGQFNLPPVLLVAMCCILLLRGNKESAMANALMVLVKLAILLFFVAIALTGFNADNLTPFFPTGAGNNAALAGVTAGAGLVFFSFIGLDTVATAGEEVRNPTRNVPIGILAALGIVTLFYMLVAIAAVGAQPAAMFAGQKAGLSVILQNVTGMAWPAMVLSAGAVISVFSVTLVTIYGQTRILYAISRDGLIPPSFSKLDPRTQAPVGNTVIVSVVVALIAGLVDSNFLWHMVSLGTLTAFIVVSIAVPVLRAREGEALTKGFKVPFGPYVIPGLSIAACLWIMSGLNAPTFKAFGYVMALALATYFLYSIRHSKLNQQ